MTKININNHTKKDKLLNNHTNKDVNIFKRYRRRKMITKIAVFLSNALISSMCGFGMFSVCLLAETNIFVSVIISSFMAALLMGTLQIDDEGWNV